MKLREEIVIGSKVDTRGFKKADSELKKLTRSVKNVAGAFGLAFSSQAILQYGKNAAMAFAEDDKAARVLTKTLDNLGLAFADADIKTFIADLEKQFGVLDDELRPAYQKLITATGDWRKSQQLLKLSLDLSAQSGEAVTTSANDLAQALVGNTKGLKKYNLGLTNAQLAAMSFEEILVRLSKVSKGQASLAADTYSGKLAKLKVAAANAQEVLGGALLDSFIKLSGGDVDKAAAKIEGFSTKVAKLTRLLTGADSLSEALNSVDYKFGIIPVERKVSTNRSASPAGTYMRNAAEIKAAAAAKKLAEEQAAAAKKLLKSQQDQIKLAKAKAIFDLQKIQIEAALKGKISKEDEIRLKLMQAIEEENLTNVEKYQKALEVAQTKTKELTELLAAVKDLELKDPFGAWSVDPLTASINELTKSMFSVGTQIQANGKEWSSFANSVATTVIRPNLSEWSSSFGAAGAAASAATTAALKAQQDALTAQTTAASAALQAQSAAQLEALKARLAEEAAAYKELMEATAAAAEAALITGENDYTTANLAKIASEAAAQAAAAAAALAAAEQAAGSTAVTGGSNVNITVNTGIGDPNAIAEEIQKIIEEATQRGTVDFLGIA